MNQPIAVLAGTPVDTQMGVDVLTAAGLNGVAYPLSANPREQTMFQVSTPEAKYQFTLELLKRTMDEGCTKAFVYCNSLSSAVDFHALADETGMKIVTPLDVYVSLAPKYKNLAFIAANAQGLAGIERTLMNSNPQLTTLSAGILPTVFAIETGMDPVELIRQEHLVELTEWFASCGMEALLLGCTHFPYFKKELAERVSLPLIDPADEMVAMLMAQ